MTESHKWMRYGFDTFVYVFVRQMQIYGYQPQQFDSLEETIKAQGRIAALAVLFEVCWHLSSSLHAFISFYFTKLQSQSDCWKSTSLHSQSGGFVVTYPADIC